MTVIVGYGKYFTASELELDPGILGWPRDAGFHTEVGPKHGGLRGGAPPDDCLPGGGEGAGPGSSSSGACARRAQAHVTST